jgi:transposase
MQVANYLKVEKQQQVKALLALGWSYRRIESETGVRRETVSKYAAEGSSKAAKVFPGSGVSEEGQSGDFGPFERLADSKAAKVFPGSDPKAAKVFSGSADSGPADAAELCRSAARVFHGEIVAKLQGGLSAKRIWQDLVEDFGYGHSYESIKRYARKLRRSGPAVGVMHSAPGEEAQVDFFRGVPTLDVVRGEWKRPWVFRMTLCHSRHGYEEAAWDQKLETFLGLHECAFQALGGVPRVVRHDNLKAAVVRACLYDPDSNVVYESFAAHWGFTPLPTRPRNPKENGKQERSGGYVKDNALKGRRFNSLDELNEHLRRWNRTIARLRIHGTTRKQVWTHYEETDKLALQPLAAKSFPFFECGERTVHVDGHVSVASGYYPVAAHLVGQKVQVRWDARLVRIFHGDTAVAVHHRVAKGCYALRPGDDPGSLSSSQQAEINRLLGRCERVGQPLHRWAEGAVEERGVRAIRLIQGVLSLARKYSRELLLRAARSAADKRLYRYKDLRRLIELAPPQLALPLLDEHPDIRPLDHYRMEDLL